MAPLKAPEPDGMPPFFYQHYWNLIGHDISNSMLNYLNSATLPDHLNHTFITLIPKKKNLEFASEFRLISLCMYCIKFSQKCFQIDSRKFCQILLLKIRVLSQKFALFLTIFW